MVFHAILWQKQNLTMDFTWYFHSANGSGQQKGKASRQKQFLKLDSSLNPYLIWEFHFDFMCVYRTQDMKNDNRLGSLDWTIIQNELGRRW